MAKNVRRKRISENLINIIYIIHGCKAAETGLQASEPTGQIKRDSRDETESRRLVTSWFQRYEFTGEIDS